MLPKGVFDAWLNEEISLRPLSRRLVVRLSVAAGEAASIGGGFAAILAVAAADPGSRTPSTDADAPTAVSAAVGATIVLVVLPCFALVIV